MPLLEENNISYGAYNESNWLSDMVFSWVIPIFIFFAIWMFLASRMQKNMGSGILGMGSSKKLINSEKPKVKFDDVAGVEEAKDEVKEIVDFLKNPERYIRRNMRRRRTGSDLCNKHPHDPENTHESRHLQQTD